MSEATLAQGPEDPAVARGRYKVGQVIALLLGFDVITIALYIGSVGTDRLPQQVGRTLVALLLCLALYRGARWARWLITALAVLAGMMIAPQAFRLLRGDISSGTLILALMFVGYVWLARILLWVPEVPVFLAAQRARRG